MTGEQPFILQPNDEARFRFPLDDLSRMEFGERFLFSF